MSDRRILDKMEDDLGHFLIKEMCKSDPSKRTSAEMYKYKGLHINVDKEKSSQLKEKTVFVRIGVFEAEFKLNSCEKCSGSLTPYEEKLVTLWLLSADNNKKIENIYKKNIVKYKVKIIPFDLENFYS